MGATLKMDEARSCDMTAYIYIYIYTKLHGCNIQVFYTYIVSKNWVLD
jgi:hypothetical protein